MSDFYKENRKKFGELMENNSFLVLFSGLAPVERGNRYYTFSAQRNMYYLTGLDYPAIVLMMKKNGKGEVTERLYLERFDETYAKWEGAPVNAEEAKETSGIEVFGFIDELKGHIANNIVRERMNTIYLDMDNRSLDAPNTPELDLAKNLQEKFPAAVLLNAHPMLGGLRRIKSAYEVEQIQKAANITGAGYLAFLDNVRPGMKEYELEAHYDFLIKKNGTGRAFDTIMASGANATVLHYHSNDSEIKDGDLVLVDFGARWNWYASDLSRTFPVNGKFSPRQRELYEIVLGAFKKVMEIVKPGTKFTDLNDAVKAHYKEELKRIGLIEDEKQIGEYYYHGVSHMLGLEVHDVGAGSTGTDGELLLAEGMVITVEPGLYIAEEGIGIRIEDDVLVTATGYKNLTEAFPKEIDDIEAYMANRKA